VGATHWLHVTWILNPKVSRSLGKWITRRNGDILGGKFGERSIKPKSSCYLGLWPPCQWFWVQLPTSSFYMLTTIHNFSIMGNWVFTMCTTNLILLITTSSGFNNFQVLKNCWFQLVGKKRIITIGLNYFKNLKKPLGFMKRIGT
jgi:hypothetical protein